MPNHASTCLCEGCERDGTGEFADRDASALARVLGCDDAALQARLYLGLCEQRGRLAKRRDGVLDIMASGRVLTVARVRS
jgi:hypothetical protein